MLLVDGRKLARFSRFIIRESTFNSDIIKETRDLAEAVEFAYKYVRKTWIDVYVCVQRLER